MGRQEHRCGGLPISKQSRWYSLPSLPWLRLDDVREGHRTDGGGGALR